MPKDEKDHNADGAEGEENRGGGDREGLGEAGEGENAKKLDEENTPGEGSEREREGAAEGASEAIEGDVKTSSTPLTFGDFSANEREVLLIQKVLRGFLVRKYVEKMSKSFFSYLVCFDPLTFIQLSLYD